MRDESSEGGKLRFCLSNYTLLFRALGGGVAVYASVTAMLPADGEALNSIGAFQVPEVLRDWHSEIRRFFSEAKSFRPKPCRKIFNSSDLPSCLLSTPPGYLLIWPCD